MSIMLTEKGIIQMVLSWAEAHKAEIKWGKDKEEVNAGIEVIISEDQKTATLRNVRQTYREAKVPVGDVISWSFTSGTVAVSVRKARGPAKKNMDLEAVTP